MTTQSPTAAADFLVPYLGHADRHIRYAARVGLEHLPLEVWQDKVLESPNADAVMTGCVGLARQGEPPLLPRLLQSLGKIDVMKLTDDQQLGLLRAYQLAFIRLGHPDDATKASLGPKFDALFPSRNNFVNRELANVDGVSRVAGSDKEDLSRC